MPPRRLCNEELSQIIDTSDEWIQSHTGILSRHIAGEETAASDLAAEAAINALAMLSGTESSAPESSGIQSSEALSLDMIVLATATADYYGTPSTACLVQEKIGAKNAAAMDINAGCTGFIYALETAAGLLSVSANRKRALVIGAEIMSKFTDWSDRRTCVLLGDGAGAVLLEKTEAPAEGTAKRGLVRTLLGADGSGAEHLIFRRGGSREPFREGETIIKPAHLDMNGEAVYFFAVQAITETINAILEQEGITMDDVNIIIPHQANARIIRTAAKNLKIPEEKFYLNIAEYANTSAASIPIALDELNRNKKLKRGDLILTIGFGGGLTYGANLIIW